MEKPQSIPTSAVVTISEQPDSSRIEALVREGLTRLAECIRKDGAPYPLTPQLVSVCVDVFQRANATPSQIEAALRKAETSCKFWPSAAEILGFISTTGSTAVEEEAARKFEQVLAYAVRLSPDFPDRNPPRISERTRRAINAAGGLDYLRECDREPLQWARKRFIEAYVRFEELNQDERLLPAGEVRELLAGASQKLLPSSKSYEDARTRGLAYAQELKDSGCERPDIKRAIRAVAGELVPRPPMRSIEEQIRILREKGFLPELNGPNRPLPRTGAEGAQR